jgi:hypothetical protein
MGAGLNLFEKPLVFVTCPRHVFISCSNKTFLILSVSSMGCMICVSIKKKGGVVEFDARFMLKSFQLSHVFLSVLTVLCALIKYTFIWNPLP